MAEYPQPTNLVPIFDPSNFPDAVDTTTSSGGGGGTYLNYPNAQGTENLLDATVNGTLQIQTGGLQTSAGTTQDFLGTCNFGVGASTPVLFGGFASTTYQNCSETHTGGASVSTYTNGGYISCTATAGTNTLSKTNVTGSAAGGNYLMSLNETISGNSLYFLPNSGAGSFNPISQAGDDVIVATGTKNAEALTLASWSDTNAGVRITADDVKVSAGGTTSGGSISVDVNGSTGIIALNSAQCPTSSATQPAAYDSSTKMPTTAWVQSAIAYANTSIPSTIVAASNMTNKTFNGFSFALGGTINSFYQNVIVNARVNITIQWNQPISTGQTVPANNISYFDGIINFSPYWTSNAGFYQQYFTQFPTNPNVSLNGVNGYVLGSNPITNIYNVPTSGATFNPGVTNMYTTATSIATGSSTTGGAYNLTSTGSNYISLITPPNTPATWMLNRWCWTQTQSSSGMYNGTQTTNPYFTFIPGIGNGSTGCALTLLIYQPNAVNNVTTFTPNGSSYYAVNATIEFLNLAQTNATVTNLTDVGGGQWNILSII